MIKEYINKFNSEFGALPLRSYYVPFDSMENCKKNKFSSKALTLLDGIWDFEKIDDVGLSETSEYKPVKSGKIRVPSTVQFQGYEDFTYLNFKYEFPFAPPYVYTKNPVYRYSRRIRVKKDDLRKILTFEGVDGGLYVKVNGKTVGFSQISKRLVEFDITEYLNYKNDKLDVYVIKFTAGSYMEDQDTWRFKGINRSVYILSRPQNRIDDYKIVANDEGVLSFTAIRGNCNVIFNGETKRVLQGDIVDFYVKDVRLWTAETPDLYDLIIEENGEYIYEKVGFRSITIKDGVLLLNKTPIKFRGICRHDFRSDKGNALSYDDLVEDIKLIKSLCCNAVRTAHYPNSPDFTKLCDEYGLYVMAEANIETHGVIARSGIPDEKLFDEIADNPIYYEELKRRQECLVERDKNRPSIVVWSLGNESGFGKNFIKCAEFVKNADATRPIQYEGMWHKKGEEIFKNNAIDLVSRMYPTFEECKNYPFDGETRPFVICEYSHAMGNGPGDVFEYNRLINDNAKICGAFLWQLWDQPILCKDGKLRYGGDFNERITDGHFNIDGVFCYNHEKSTKQEVIAAYYPISVDTIKDRHVFKSNLSFVAIVVKIQIELYKKNNLADKSVREIVLQPNQTFSIPANEKCDFEKITMFTKEYGERIVSFRHNVESVAIESKNAPIVEENDRSVIVKTNGNEFIIDKTSGELFNKRFATPLSLALVRAPMDNDSDYVFWKEQGLFDLKSYSKTINVTKNGNNAEVDICAVSVAQYRSPVFEYSLKYKFYSDDVVEITLSGKYGEFIKELPRIGFKFALRKNRYKRYSYLGYGPSESYADKCAGAYYGRFDGLTDDIKCQYLIPQEFGTHKGVDEFSIVGKNTIKGYLNEGYFQIIPYSVDELMNKKHDYELKEDGKLYVYVGFAERGCGSVSCGPPLDDKYRILNFEKGKVILRF